MRRNKLSARVLQIVIFCSLLFVGSNYLIAQGHNGDPSLCGRKRSSEGQTSGPNGVVYISNRQISECSIVKPETLNSSNPGLTTFLAEVKKDLWDSKRLPKDTLYRYTFNVINDWDKNADYNFSDWNVVHSPYVIMQKSFALKLPACSVATIQFISPWAPEVRTSPVNVGFYNEDGKEWTMMGVGTASILTPTWLQYYPEEFKIERLPISDARTKACSLP